MSNLKNVIYEFKLILFPPRTPTLVRVDLLDYRQKYQKAIQARGTGNFKYFPSSVFVCFRFKFRPISNLLSRFSPSEFFTMDFPYKLI